MKLFIHHSESNQRLEIDIKKDQTVKEIKEIVEEHFQIDTTSTDGLQIRAIVLQYAGSELNEDWILNDLTIPTGSTIKCFVKVEPIPDYFIYKKFNKELIPVYDTGIDTDSTILEMRVYISNLIGFPLTTFRLKSNSDHELYDDLTLDNYAILKNNKYQFIIETWQGWDNFLIVTIKGFSKQAFKYMSSDELIKQYQIKVACHIGAHYGCFELVNTMMNMGAHADEPVGGKIISKKKKIQKKKRP
jgi:hypothetical protein